MAWGGREKGAEITLQLQHLQIRTQAKLQRRPPLQIHRKIGLLSGGVRMYCSHLLDAASVLNCRWLYYTQEDANGMYESQCKWYMHLPPAAPAGWVVLWFQDAVFSEGREG